MFVHVLCLADFYHCSFCLLADFQMFFARCFFANVDCRLYIVSLLMFMGLVRLFVRADLHCLFVHLCLLIFIVFVRFFLD